MTQSARPIEKVPGLGAGVSGAAVAAAFVALPAAWLDSAIRASGVAALLPIATPPLDMAARGILALGGGALTAIVIWAALYSILDAGGFLAGSPHIEGVPSVRRADAHPDAPPRRPLSVAELTASPMPLGRADPPEQPLPIDLDTPLSALDPAAIPIMPREPVRPVAPLAPGERLRTFALTPPPPPAPLATEAPSIEGLLRRLGQGAGRRVSTQ